MNAEKGKQDETKIPAQLVHHSQLKPISITSWKKW